MTSFSYFRAKHAVARRICRLGIRPRFSPVPVSFDCISHPVLMRPATSDYLVGKQIFIEQEYKPVTAMEEPKLIVDCGANAGYASVYFLSRFPSARLIALEPDPDNYQICCRNIQPYGDRAKILQKALWSHPAKLTLLHFGKLGDQGEMGVQVFENAGDGFPEHVHVGINPPIPAGEVDAIDVDTILQMGRPIDILKLDIEKAEMVVFANPNLSWINSVRNIVIELHNAEATKRFRKATEAFDYEYLTSGELTICKNIHGRRAH